MPRRVVLFSACSLLLATVALATEPTRDIVLEELYGTWRGTWAPTFQFTRDRVQLGYPPYRAAAVEFLFHPFTSDHGSYTVEGGFGGTTIGLAYAGPNLFGNIFFPNEGEPNGFGQLNVTLTGNRLVGELKELAPASPTFVHWEGPIVLTKTDIVPNEAIIGRWRGEVVEPGAEVPKYSVDMTINGFSVGAVAGAIEYPELECGGTLILLSRNGNEFRFRERIRAGEPCADNGLLVLAVTSDALEFQWFFPEDANLVASGSLERSPFDALNDCPCVPPSDTIVLEQSRADAAALTQNLMDAGDEIPRCGDIRSAFYENYHPDKVQMELDLYSQERRCALNAVGILRDAGIHGTRINGELNDVAVGEAAAAVDTLLDAFIGFYRQVRGLQDLASVSQSVSPRSAEGPIAVTTFLERSFIEPEETLRNKKELLVEATVELNGDEQGLLSANDHFADTFEIRGEQALGVMTVTRVSNDEARVDVTLKAFLTETPCAGDCDDASDVTVNEIITLVNIALGTGEVSGCRQGDTDHNNEITVDEILTAVNAALTGCSSSA